LNAALLVERGDAFAAVGGAGGLIAGLDLSHDA
jgi:hypothetical protein